jgi:excisionase family DNA binding protein
MYSKTLQITKRETLDLWPDTARLLGIGRNSVYQAARRGDFRTVRVGKRILVPKSEIRRLLKCGSKTAALVQAAAGSECEAQ